MNRKGFTLIELLAVIVIMSGISLVAVAGISASLNNRTESECSDLSEQAISAAKIYFSLTDKNRVKIGTLISEGYFNENSNIDLLDSNKYVTFDTSKMEYGCGNLEGDSIIFSNNKKCCK